MTRTSRAPRLCMQIAYMPSPIGTLCLSATESGLQSIACMPASFEAIAPTPSSAILETAIVELTEYFAGQRMVFDVPLAVSAATPFYQAVWRALQQIPYGTTVTYGEIARRVHRPKAVRAVGAANHSNPLPIIIPCHRVIAQSGALQGYAYGLATKDFLLRLEKKYGSTSQLSFFE